MSNKTIKITPDFFKFGSNKSSNRTIKNNKNKDKQLLSQLLKPNNVKKALLQKLKDRQQKEQDLIQNDITIKNDETSNFENEFEKTLSYLETIIKQKEDRKKTLKNKKQSIQNNTNEAIVNNIQEQIETNNHTTPNLVFNIETDSYNKELSFL